MLPPGIFKRGNIYAQSWRRVQYLANQFWTRWQREYLLNLQPRKKWTGEIRNVEIGDFVIVQDDGPRNYWRLGRVVSVMRGTDAKVRAASLKTASGSVTRPITKLVLLMKAEEQ